MSRVGQTGPWGMTTGSTVRSVLDDAVTGSDGAVRRDRRRLLRDTAVLALGAGIGSVGFNEYTEVADGKVAIHAADVAATVNGLNGATGRGRIMMTWEVPTEHPLIALTFDDGPRPDWTDMVLRTLEEHKVPATFFMIGRRVRKYGHVVKGRLGRHEVGNHTWNHLDLATRDDEQARSDLLQGHQAIVETLGITPRLFRPPYGHVGGAAALAAAELGYQMILWSRKMREATYNTRQQVEVVLRETTPGTILLAHDVGAADRLVSLRGLPDMITGLRARGFEFVTVSDLIASAQLAV